MVGSSKNRIRLTKALRSVGFHARNTTQDVICGRVAPDEFDCVFVWPNGREGGYMRIRGPQKDQSRYVDGNFNEIFETVCVLLDKAGVPRSYRVDT